MDGSLVAERTTRGQCAGREESLSRRIGIPRLVRGHRFPRAGLGSAVVARGDHAELLACGRRRAILRPGGRLAPRRGDRWDVDVSGDRATVNGHSFHLPQKQHPTCWTLKTGSCANCCQEKATGCCVAWGLEMMSDENMEASEGCMESRITVWRCLRAKTDNQRSTPLFPPFYCEEVVMTIKNMRLCWLAAGVSMALLYYRPRPAAGAVRTLAIAGTR